MENTLYWHDYETSGIDPRCDRAVQFAGVRTDEELNIIGEPLMIYARPADDMLFHPVASLITGITPQLALEQGVTEAEFIARIHGELAKPGTCGVGYNSIRFDDEFTRYTLYRNLMDPYGREWQSGNSRWDIIDMVRMTHDLRPEGIVWPKNERGRTSFRLELLTAANGIGHEQAHDALSDVYATIAMARLIREKQPRLYNYLYKMRLKREVAQLLDLQQMTPLLHTSGMYSGEHGCTTLVVPLAEHPTNKNAVIVYDLRFDPGPLLSLDAETIREQLYTPTDQLPEGTNRIPLKQLHRNKSPAVAPAGTMDEAAAERLGIDTARCLEHREQLMAASGLAEKIARIFSKGEFESDNDPDHNLYGGGFFSDADRRRMDQIHTATAEELAEQTWRFDDPRLPEMLFRYRARNWPESLSDEERAEWEEFRNYRLTDPKGGANITIDSYRKELAELRAVPERSVEEHRILDALETYGERLLRQAS